MKRFAILMLAMSFVLTALAAPSMAAKSKSAKSVKTAASLKCPACGMPMPTHKTATMTVPVKINGKTYYCCSQCPAGKAHMKSSKPAAKKSM